MALSSEDKSDVKRAMGKAMANKVAKVTRDYPTPKVNADKAKAYDSKHGKDAYHYSKTKIGRAQSKAYDAYFFGGKTSTKSKALQGKRTNTHNSHGNKWGSPEAIKDFKKDYGHK